MRETCAKKIFYTFWIGMILVLAGCTKEAQPHSIVNIGDQYEIKLHQELSENGGLVSLQINSLDLQNCENATIAHQAIISDQKIQIVLDDIKLEGSCVPGPAIISEEILMQTSNPSVPFEINLKNAVLNYGTLYSDKSEFEIIFSQFDGLKISRTHVNRVRPGMIWGSYSTSEVDVADQLQTYLQSIDNGMNELKGDYGHFYYSQDESVVIYNHEEQYDFSFLLTSIEDFEMVKDKFLELKGLDASLVLKATNYDGSDINIQ